MNERIKTLAEQAKNFMTDQVLYQSRVHDRTLSIDEGADIFEEKFAELIVKECADWIDCSPATNAGQLILTKSFIIANLKEHFGVEE